MQSIEQFVAQLSAHPPAGSRIDSPLLLPPLSAPSAEFPEDFPAWLSSFVRSQGIERLTAEQWHALHLLRQHQNVCLAMPTGGGRGVVRLLAMYRSLVTTQHQRALCIFPHKSRAYAQCKTITSWNAQLPPEHRLAATIYDGDTPKTQRRSIKQSPPQLLLTTPEMLHAGILAYHGGWRAFFQDLSCIVLADMHLCTGALGAHMAHLLRRLQRVSRYYGAQPQYLVTSVPLANIQDVVQTLTGQPCTVVAGEAWQRQLQSRLLIETRGDPVAVCRALLTRLHEAHLPPLVMAPDVLLPHFLPIQGVGRGKEAAEHPEMDLAMCPRPVTQEAYHLAESGVLRSAHTALAIPHDTPVTAVRPSALRSVVFLGIPSSLTLLHEYLSLFASSHTPSISMLILTNKTPLERYLLRYPAVYQTFWTQDLRVNASNPQVARHHLLCAAADLALDAGERYAGIHGLDGLIHELAAAKAIARRTTSRQWVATQRQPHRRVRLRTYEPSFALINQHDGRLLSRLEAQRAFRECFEGAIYSHAGETFHVERVMTDRRRIVLRPTHAAYVTQGLVKASIEEQRIEASIAKDAFCIAYGSLVYAQTLESFERLEAQTRARLSVHALPDTRRQYRTQGVWIDFPDTYHTLPQAAVHTFVHAVLVGLPLLLCDSSGIRGGMDTGEEPGSTSPEAVFVDETPGGNGLSACLYQAHECILRVGLQILLQCECEHGCDRCVAAQKCDACARQALFDRQAGIALLQRMLGEVAPALEKIRPLTIPPAASALGERGETPRHIYLCLSTQKSAADVGGWQHKHLLGLGVAVTYDTHEGRYQVYTAETVEALVASLRQADLIIGFNLRDFDYQVLQPNAETSLATLPTLAILDEVHKALGFRLSLSHLVQETLGIDRPDDSIRTLRWFHEGDRERIVEHCRRDIELLRHLVRYGAETGTICYRDHSGARRVLPVNWQFTAYHGQPAR